MNKLLAGLASAFAFGTATFQPVSAITLDDLVYYQSSTEPVHLTRRTDLGDAMSIYEDNGLRLFMTKAACNAGFFLEVDSPRMAGELETLFRWGGAMMTHSIRCYPKSVNETVPIYYLGEQIGSALVQASGDAYGLSNWRSEVTLTKQPAPAPDRAQRIVQEALDNYLVDFKYPTEFWANVDPEALRIVASRNADVAMMYYFYEERENLSGGTRDWPLTPTLELASQLGSSVADVTIAHILAGGLGFGLQPNQFDPSVVYAAATLQTDLPRTYCLIAKAAAARNFEAVDAAQLLQSAGADMGDAVSYVAANGGAQADCNTFAGTVPTITVALRDQPCAPDRPNLAPFSDELNASADNLLLNRTCSSSFALSNALATEGAVNPMAALSSIRPVDGRCQVSNMGFDIDLRREVQNVQCGTASNGVVQCTAAMATYCGPRNGDLRSGGFEPSAHGLACLSVTGGETHQTLPVVITAQYDAGSCAWQTKSVTIADKVTIQ